MTRLAPLALAAALIAPPLAAQEAGEAPGLIEEGANMLLRGLIEELQPPLEDLAGIGAEMLPTFQLLAREMGPAFVEVFGQIDSIAHYEPPAFLPNGDIILRRRPDAPAWTPPEPEPEGAPEPDAGSDRGGEVEL